MLAQLRAAGVRTLFHTNTSGFVRFWEAIYAAGDVQVINMTHEGQAVAAAAGYAMASKNLGFFFGSGVGIMQRAEQHATTPGKIACRCSSRFRGGRAERSGNGYLRVVGQHSSDRPSPSRRGPATCWPTTSPSTLRRAIKFAFGPPSGPVTLTVGARGREQVQASIYKIDLATMRHQIPRAPAMLIEKAAQWLDRS